MNIQEDGFEIKPHFISNRKLHFIKDEIENFSDIDSNYGIRNADKKYPRIKEIAHSSRLINQAKKILGSTPKLVRVIFFDKTPEQNWLVAWHQDKTIALNQKMALAGWNCWTLKDNVHHVQPPITVLNSMITFRLHLDDADKDNGCLKVIPKSHQKGILSHQAISQIAKTTSAFLCEVKAGDLVIMKPHIIHSSSKSKNPKHRRIIHIEYSNYLLPKGLEWV